MKKRFIALFITMIFVMSLVLGVVVQADEPYLAGDVNGDKKVNGDDVIALYQYYKNDKTDNISKSQDLDYNGDGKKDSNDATYLLYSTLFGSSKYSINEGSGANGSSGNNQGDSGSSESGSNSGSSSGDSGSSGGSSSGGSSSGGSSSGGSSSGGSSSGGSSSGGYWSPDII